MRHGGSARIERWHRKEMETAVHNGDRLAVVMLCQRSGMALAVKQRIGIKAVAREYR